MSKIPGAAVAVVGSDSFGQEVAQLIARIGRTQTGQAVFAAIRAHGAVLIRPYEGGDFNAQALPQPILGRVAIVEYSPSTFARVVSVAGVKIPNARAILSRGMEADEVLIHELLHAARYLSGDLATTPVTGKMAPYENEEEFHAILVQNIYASEKGKPSAFLRTSHFLEPVSVPSQETVDELFLYQDDNYRLIEKFCRQHPQVSKMLSRVSARFNPIRAFYETTQVKLVGQYEAPAVPHRVSQRETLPPLTDDYLIGILKPRFHAGDVAGYGARVRKLVSIFEKLKALEAVPLLARLELRPGGDRVAMYFHHHLSTASRETLVNILRGRLAKF